MIAANTTENEGELNHRAFAGELWQVTLTGFCPNDIIARMKDVAGRTMGQSVVR